MEDPQIVDLYFARDERAIRETDCKYGGYCYTIAYNILANQEDAEESVNDTYMAVWNTIPPCRPSLLVAFLGKITRHISIDQWRKRSAYKRTGGEVPIALEELGDVTGDPEGPEAAVTRKELAAELNRFMDSLPETERSVFLCRYWYLDSIGDIAKKTGFSTSKIASMLYRIRGNLKKQLIKEGIL